TPCPATLCALHDALPIYERSIADGCPIGRAHRAGIGDSLPGDVEGGAMIDRGPQDRQTHCHGYRSIEVEGLRGDVALVVVLGENAVEPAGQPLMEDRIGGDRSRDLEVSCSIHPLDCGAQDLDLLIAEGSVLTPMG